MTAGCDVGQALKSLRQHRAAPIPKALAAEVAARQVLGQRERPDGDAAHRGPVSDPGLRLPRGPDRYRRGGAAARAHPAPEGRAAQAAKYPGHPCQTAHRVRQRHRDAATPQKATEPILVLAELDHRSGREEHAARKSPTGTRERPDLAVRGRDEQVDAGSRDHACDVPEEGVMRDRMNEKIAIRGRFLEYEAVAMASRNEEGGVACFQASDQIAAWSAACPGDEKAHRHAILLAIGLL